jgi:exosortase
MDLMDYAWDWDNENASQIFLIPFISLMLLYQKRNKIFETIGTSVVPAALLALGGIALALVSTTPWSAQLMRGDRLGFSTLAVELLLLAGFLFFYGSQAFRAGMFPLLFLVFAIPIPSYLMERAISFLQHGSADVTYIMLKATGMPVFRQDTIFVMPNLSIEVAPECSGIRSGISLFILSVMACHMFLKTWSRRAILIAVAVPILIFKNALRISTLSYLAVNIDPRIITSRLHQEGGIPFFLLGLLLIYPILSLLMRSERNQLVPRRTQEVNP